MPLKLEKPGGWDKLSSKSTIPDTLPKPPEKPTGTVPFILFATTIIESDVTYDSSLGLGSVMTLTTTKATIAMVIKTIAASKYVVST